MPVLKPPPEYDTPFSGRKIIENESYGDINKDPRNSLRATDQPGQMEQGFSWTFHEDPNDPTSPIVCHIVLPPTFDLGKELSAAILQHENAHCNGWPETHPGATLF